MVDRPIPAALMRRSIDDVFLDAGAPAGTYLIDAFAGHVSPDALWRAMDKSDLATLRMWVGWVGHMSLEWAQELQRGRRYLQQARTLAKTLPKLRLAIKAVLDCDDEAGAWFPEAITAEGNEDEIYEAHVDAESVGQGTLLELKDTLAQTLPLVETLIQRTPNRLVARPSRGDPLLRSFVYFARDTWDANFNFRLLITDNEGLGLQILAAAWADLDFPALTDPIGSIGAELKENLKSPPGFATLRD